MSKIRFVGLDVHADSIAVAIAEPDGEVSSSRHDSEPFGVYSQTGGQTGWGSRNSGASPAAFSVATHCPCESC
jgi:hypothetical protein